MTPEELITEQSQRHHAAIQQITQVMGQTQVDVKQTQGDVKRILEMLAGTFERPGMVHRLASVEARPDLTQRVALIEAEQARLSRVTPEERRALWWHERKTKIFDAILVTVVVGGLAGLLLLGVRGFILDTVKDLSITQSTGADGQITIVKKAPKPPECPDCGIATVQAEQE